jgi:integrase
MPKLTLKEIENPHSTYQKRFNKLPPKKEYLLLDEDRLYLRIRNNHLRNWLFVYKFEGKQYKLSINGEDITSIRKQAGGFRKLIDEGINPKQKLIDDKKNKKLKQQQHDSRINVRDLFDKWESIDLKDYKRGTKDIKQSFERYVFPVIGDLAIEDVKKSHIMTITDNIKIKGLTRTPRMVFGHVRQMFRFALERDYINAEPTATIRKAKAFKPAKERDRFLSEDEIRELFEKLPNAGLTKASELALKICISTACRIGEILNAKWQNVSLDDATWLIPSEDSKNGEPIKIALSPYSLSLFKELKNYGYSNTYCVPNRKDTAPISNKSVGKQIYDRQLPDNKEPLKGRTKQSDSLMLAGGKWTTHDLRRTAATLMSMLGVMPDVIDKCLNHKEQNRIKGIYQRYDYQKEKREAWKILGERLEMLENGAKIAKIIRIK